MEERLQKVAAFAGAMVDRYLSARQKLAIMEPFVEGDIPKLFDNSYGAHAHGALALTLLLDLIRDICAFTLDRDSRVTSLVNIWRQIQADDLHAALRHKVAQPPKSRMSFDPGFSVEEMARWQTKFHERDVQERGAAFDETFARVSKHLPELVGSEVAGKLWTARNKVIAHYEMQAIKDGPKLYPLGEVGLKWGEPKDFMRQLDPVLWDVVLLATWGSYDVEGFEEMHKLYAADFWARLKGKPPVK